jgi:hypothetical protein
MPRVSSILRVRYSRIHGDGPPEISDGKLSRLPQAPAGFSLVRPGSSVLRFARLFDQVDRSHSYAAQDVREPPPGILGTSRPRSVSRRRRLSEYDETALRHFDEDEWRADIAPAAAIMR